jgi:N-acetyl-gamma-glutamyl-phosphate reductase
MPRLILRAATGFAMPKVFIDGQVGTTGLEIFDRLQGRGDIELITIDDAQRKDSARRQACLQQADVAILCLPDDAAREAVRLADGQTRILDASTAHRTMEGWAYGLPELHRDARAEIKSAQFVSNPGCYPQGFVLLVRPLISAGLLDSATALRCHAVSGYSGGGRQMVETFQAYSADEAQALNVQDYALTLQHKHVPEMHTYSLTETRPLFAPSVANYYKGMLVHVPLFTAELSDATRANVLDLLNTTYATDECIRVTDGANEDYLNPTACNGTNYMDLIVLGNDKQLLLVARYDNLGKGASGAAVQNLNLMLGLNEMVGL